MLISFYRIIFYSFIFYSFTFLEETANQSCLKKDSFKNFKYIKKGSEHEFKAVNQQTYWKWYFPVILITTRQYIQGISNNLRKTDWKIGPR